MSEPIYKLVKSGDYYQLYEHGAFLVKFQRSSFREDLASLGRSSHWIGTILKILNKKYPSPAPHYLLPSPFEDALRRYGDHGLADYLRSKGFRVTKALKVSDREIIAHLESRGYLVEGLVSGSYYATVATNPLEASLPAPAALLSAGGK